METPSSDKFVDLLNLRGKNYNGVSLDGILITVHDFAEKIWDKPRLFNFVDHGVAHSLRVASNTRTILQHLCPANFILSDIERLVLGIAALVHDVGMQYPKYEKGDRSLTLKEIREQHTTLGNEMVLDAIGRRFSERGGPDLPCTEEQAMFIHLGATAGFGHSGPEFWDRLKEAHYKQTYEGGEQILRMRLLAAAFRLADEVHTEYTRISEPNYIVSSQIDDKDKCHWMACYYVRAIDFSSPGSGSLRMVMQWRIPEDSKEEDIDVIRALLVEMREVKIRREIEFVNPYLRADESMAECVVELKLERSPQTHPSVRPLPSEVAFYVRNTLCPYQFKTRAEPTLTGVCELPEDAQIERLKGLARDFVLSGEGTLSGHFRLKTKWHTNKYIRCRELSSNLEFVRALSVCLNAFYSKDNFTDVLAIGTSAIRIASNLAFLMGARLSYTFADARVGGGSSAEGAYTDQERKVRLQPAARVLIVDDILGVGSVLESQVGNLKSNYAPDYIRAFTLYSLGHDKEFVIQLGDLKVDYLVSFPDVVYRPELPGLDVCDMCRTNPPTSRIEE